MGRLLKAFFFKLKRDLAFKITLIIGASMAVLTVVIFALMADGKALTGPNMLFTSLSPIQNYGIALPINLISFICLEFSQGSIRNKIIAGNSKLKIYISLCVSGIVYVFALLLVYAGICTILGTIFGGFDLSKQVILVTSLIPGFGNIDGAFLFKYIVIMLLIYLMLCMFATFVATSLRTIGPSIPIVVTVILFGFLGVTVVVSTNPDNEILIALFRYLVPFYGIISPTLESTNLVISDIDFIGTVICNLVWSILFFVFGCLEFKKRDVK